MAENNGIWNGIIEGIKRLIRPAFTFSLLWWDFRYFSPGATEWTETQEQTLFILNLLILGFWFGERFFKNALPVVLPLVENIFKAKNGNGH